MESIGKQLPKGWSIASLLDSSNDLWITYREAKVLSAISDGSLKIFIRLPIFDTTKTFTLYQIFSLPEPDNDGIHGIVFSNLPNFIAVSKQKEYFVELQWGDVHNCRKSFLPVGLCHFHTPLGLTDRRDSCALALLLGDEERKRKSCKTKFINWPGNTALYLSNREWAVSALTSQDILISCPLIDTYKINLPPIGIFQIPVDCTGRTKEWIFSASTEGKLSSQFNDVIAPILPLEVITPDSSQRFRSFETPLVILHTENKTKTSLVSKILTSNDHVRQTNDLGEKEMDELIQNSRFDQHRYPYEWISVFSFIFMMFYFYYKLYNLEKKLKLHLSDES